MTALAEPSRTDVAASRCREAVDLLLDVGGAGQFRRGEPVAAVASLLGTGHTTTNRSTSPVGVRGRSAPQ